MRIGVASDIHAGLGEHDPALRKGIGRAVRNAADFFEDKDIDTLILNGDITDHLANRLALGTNPEIAQEQLRPIVEMMQRNRTCLQVVLAGNTDWPISSTDKIERDIYFEHTGLDADRTNTPARGMIHEIVNDDVWIDVAHGHAFKPAQWGHVGAMSEEEYAALHRELQQPSPNFLADISATEGSHRSDYLKACVIGGVVKCMPAAVRHAATNVLGASFTQGYERHFARMLAAHVGATHKKIIGIMGHTHVPGIRSYDDVTIVNTGTTGAKLNPLQRISDPRGHVAIVDTEKGHIDLVQTYSGTAPFAGAASVGKVQL